MADTITHERSARVHRQSHVASSRKWTVTRITMVLVAGAILLPQGVGLPLPGGLPNLDLPRLAMVGVILLLAARVLTTGGLAERGAPRTLALLAGLMILQMASAAASEAARGSTIWAVGNLLTTWLFAFAVISLTGGIPHQDKVVRVLTVVAALLCVWSVAELVTQHKLVPVRNLWTGETTSFSTTLRRQVPGSSTFLPLMSIGPFAVNLTLAAFLCALGGFLLVRRRSTSTKRHGLSVALLILAVLGTQSRAGFMGLAAMVVINLASFGSFRERRRLILMGAAAGALVWLVGGDQFSLAFGTAYSDAVGADGGAGSFGSRLGGLGLLAEQFSQWWLLGFGPGSLFDMDRVPTSLQVQSDPGSYFAFFVESGLIAGLMLTALVGLSIRDGLRSRVIETRAAALGLTGFWVTTLSSITPWGWGIALVLAGFIESWTREERRTDRQRRASLPRRLWS